MNQPRLWPDGTPICNYLADTSEDAEQRYKHALDCDPFPQIPDALLNSGDIYDYVCATGMIWRFDPSRLKAASYEVTIGDTCIFWDAGGKRHDVALGSRGSFVLRRNSIVFVVTAEEFRLPHYMALRFNLRITNVHRGILLGTGPLVDPGFAGKLLVPLHNLTMNDYEFRAGDPFAWFEFTKISPHVRWRSDWQETRSLLALKGEYIYFPNDKKWLKPDDYFDKALVGVQPKVIGSSIPESMLRAQEVAEEANKSAADARNSVSTIRNWAFGVGVFGGIAVLVGVVSVALASWQLVWGVQESVSQIRSALTELTTRLEDGLPELEEAGRALSARLNDISRTVEGLRGDLDTMEGGAAALQDRLDSLLSEIAELRRSRENEPDRLDER